MTDTYENRKISVIKIEKMTPGKDGGATILMDDGFTCYISAAVVSAIREDSIIEVETMNLSHITGWRIDGVWIEHKSDQELQRDREELQKKKEQKEAERLASHREEWAAREAALPDWLRVRLENFHERGGEYFEKSGWEYELQVAELAFLYFNGSDVDQYGEDNLCSGNQDAWAKALLKMHREGLSLANTISALSPITGDAFYEEDQQSMIDPETLPKEGAPVELCNKHGIHWIVYGFPDGWAGSINPNKKLPVLNRWDKEWWWIVRILAPAEQWEHLPNGPTEQHIGRLVETNDGTVTSRFRLADVTSGCPFSEDSLGWTISAYSWRVLVEPDPDAALIARIAAAEDDADALWKEQDQ